VLSTIRPDGRSRQSVVYFLLEGGRIVLSTESKRAKARDVERSGWASMCVIGPERPFPSVTVEGPARIRREGIASQSGEIFALVSGNPAPDLTDEALAAIDRVILEIDIERVYGASYLTDPDPK
jgi:PPOX class probable F420-dependent enzyme